MRSSVIRLAAMEAPVVELPIGKQTAHKKSVQIQPVQIPHIRRMIGNAVLYFIALSSIGGQLAACNPESNGNPIPNSASAGTTLKATGQNLETVQITSDTRQTGMKLKITIGQNVVSATLDDNPTSRDFVSLLPLTLTLTDYNSTEKISNLPRKLSVQGAPAGYKPSPGDLTLYAPWGNLALFYKEFDYSTGLIRLGKLDGGIDAFKVPGPVQVKVELAQ